jgi:hypothetical protein
MCYRHVLRCVPGVETGSVQGEGQEMGILAWMNWLSSFCPQQESPRDHRTPPHPAPPHHTISHLPRLEHTTWKVPPSWHGCSELGMEGLALSAGGEGDQATQLAMGKGQVHSRSPQNNC